MIDCDRDSITNAFPRLIGSAWEPTSDVDGRYNCIAWAAGKTDESWWPDGGFWPIVFREISVECFVEAFQQLGFVECSDESLECDFEKVAIYGYSSEVVNHMARQLPCGQWTSKCGISNDITHALSALESDVYGKVLQIMKRPIPLDETILGQQVSVL